MANLWWLEWAAGTRQLRAEIAGEVIVGRHPSCDVVIDDDPYVSRRHCIIQPDGARLLVSLCPGARNPLIVDGAEVESVILSESGSFIVGVTPMHAWNRNALRESETRELPQRPAISELVLVASTRELLDRRGRRIAQFSASEYVAFAMLARRYPDAADHPTLGRAVWGDTGYDQYQLHRLLQRLRMRLGELAIIVENVRGAGYRLRRPVDVR